MKILITGGTGLLGKALTDTASPDIDMLLTYVGGYSVEDQANKKYRKLDVLDDAGGLELFKSFQPDVVIHAASIGSPDFAEKNKEITWKINVEGTEKIIKLCEKTGSKLIYISSNGIYDGDNAPYAEDDIAAPINFYGMTKLEGEILTKKAHVPTCVVRPILMYGWNHPFERGNIVTAAISKLKKKEKMFVYDDVFSNPLFSEQCADSIWKIISSSITGQFNIAGADRVSIYGLIKKVASVFGLDEDLVAPVKQGYFNELVKRPKDTSYVTDKMKNELGLEPLLLTEGLKNMRDRQK